MPLNLANCSSICNGCIKSYKKKHDLKRGQTFDVQCEGIPDFENKQLALFAEMSGEEAKTARSLLDPVQWAKEVLDWHCFDPDGAVWKRKDPKEYYQWLEEHPGEPILGHSRYHRPYQAEMLSCTSKRKVFRIGRQCIVKGQYVYSPNGPIEVSSVQEGQVLLGGTSNFIDSHEDSTYRISFANGTSLDVNGEHPFFTQSGWKKADDLTVQDGVQFLDADKFPINKTTTIPASLAKLLGYLLSDGYFAPRQSVKFTNNNLALIEDVEHLVTEHFPSLHIKRRPKNNGYDVHFVQKHGTSQHNPLDLYLQEVDVYYKDTLGHILTAGDEAIKSFIAGYFNGDGYLWHYKRPTRPGYRSEIGFAIGVSERRAYEFQYLLWRLGIHSIIKKEWMKKSTQWFYRVLVSQHESQLKLLDFLDPIKYPDKFLQHKEILATYRKKQKQEFIRVKNIHSLGTKRVYSWESDSGEIIGPVGMRTHNCGKTECLIVSILYHLFTKPNIPEGEGFKVIVIAPFQSQIDLVFNRLIQLLRNSPLIANSLKRHVKAPIYTLELHNGSLVRGFTAGTKSGGNAASVRGQTGHMLVFDEADYLAPEDVEAALNIITNQPNATVWMSSTPTGKRDRFYNTCMSKIWKEFHFSSYVNPIYSQQQDQMFREQMSELTYKHEILAEFGEQEEGVFQNAYIQAARKPFRYGEMQRQSHWIYTMGVDWNDVKNGTTIAVVGFNPNTMHFFFVDRAIVQREGWNQLAACQKVADLNRIWHPKSIYLDSGYGGTQYEVLKKFGYDSALDPNKGPGHPDAKLRDIIKQYDFGSKVTVHDLFTKQPTDKPAKPFLVENTVRRFESSQLSLPFEDTSIEKQLQSYIIDRITPTGVPVYKASDEAVGDHMLDALMLALVAFTLEQTPFGKPSYSSAMGFAPYFGNKLPEHEAGGLIIQPHPDQVKDVHTKHRPSMDRSTVFEKSTLMSTSKSLPANHARAESGQIGLWSWPGFGSDSPKPRVRSMAEAEKVAKQRLGITTRTSCRPRRKNI